MLEFYSASTRMANPERAILECLEVSLGLEDQSCDLIILHATMGHPLQTLVDNTRKHCPGARVIAASCGGIVGREGVSESMKDVALMAVRGKEFSISSVDDLSGGNSFDKGKALAEDLIQQNPDVNMVFLLASGIDIANDRVLEGMESVLGTEITIFGATTSDNMRGISSFQALDDQVFEHSAIAVGFSDSGLTVETQATHGFVASGEPMTVTRATGNRVNELDGKPAWETYTERLGLDTSATTADTIPIGAVAEELPADLADAYGNQHILRVVTHVDDDGSLVYATDCAEGTKLWLTVRDEDLIFNDLDRLIGIMDGKSAGKKPVAVFQADCLARGRRLFNRIMKEELVERMQHPFSTDGEPPPWIGMYGFGEYARLSGDNAYHNYTTALAAIYRKND